MFHSTPISRRSIRDRQPRSSTPAGSADWFECLRTGMGLKRLPTELPDALDERAIDQSRMTWDGVGSLRLDHVACQLRRHAATDQVQPDDRRRTVPTGKAVDI